ncbi:glycosyltransferase family 4 protein [Vibrio vulnificus]|uniref:glycosyltransferase family 4 protein n=1 Tax=Vibrio vulnificus TaxID=672 RepID=UPI001CDC95E0|nr:glycosyltransferase family 4 protein [Vibrio vulnificus]MCA3950719.1 glycosyltransferase family 4 protein [Vibrio vulnificus]
MKFVYVVNSSDFFCSHFLNLAESLRSNFDAEVHIIVGDKNQIKYLEMKGFFVHYLALSRKGINPLFEAKSILDLHRLFKKINPDFIHSFTIKPIVYTGLVTTFFLGNVKHKVYSVTGLGSLFLSKRLKDRFLWKIVTLCYKYAFSSKKSRVFFENSDDMALFLQGNIVSKDKTFLVNGAGIDTDFFSPSEKKTSPNKEQLVVTFVGRLLKDKGVRELIEASKDIFDLNINVKILVVGDIDANNISSLTLDEINEADKNGYISYLGHRKDINEIYRKTDVACLPSYREGLPKSLIEASASGCAILTTDTPGCRQTVIEGRNGVLCQVKSSKSLAEKILFFHENRHILERMKSESRVVALERYGHELINQTFFRGYGL